MKLPAYIKKVDWSPRPTRCDPVGCDGFFIRSMKIAWWYYPVALIRGCCEWPRARLKMWAYVRQFFKRPRKRFKFYVLILLVLPAFCLGCILSRFKRSQSL